MAVAPVGGGGAATARWRFCASSEYGGVQRVENDVLVVSIDRLMPVVRSAGAQSYRPYDRARDGRLAESIESTGPCAGGRGCNFDDRVRRARASPAHSLSAPSGFPLGCGWRDDAVRVTAQQRVRETSLQAAGDAPSSL